jgi:hypothetical protein
MSQPQERGKCGAKAQPLQSVTAISMIKVLKENSQRLAHDKPPQKAGYWGRMESPITVLMPLCIDHLYHSVTVAPFALDNAGFAGFRVIFRLGWTRDAMR